MRRRKKRYNLILERKYIRGRDGFFTEGKKKGGSSVLSCAILLAPQLEYVEPTLRASGQQ